MFGPHYDCSGAALLSAGPVGLVHVDAHMDTADKALGEKLYHGTLRGAWMRTPGLQACGADRHQGLFHDLDTSGIQPEPR